MSKVKSYGIEKFGSEEEFEAYLDNLGADF